VLNRIEARVGDHVVIGVSESGLLRGSLAVYAVPLSGLFAGALAAYVLASRFYPAWPVDPVAITGALAGFVSGLVWLRGFSRRTATNPAYQPVVLRQHIRTGNG
jgi:sigma-E factor negative regulatory protein RseC